MIVFYANPVFSEYRVPFYQHLNYLFGGDFYIMYAPSRYKQLSMQHQLPLNRLQLKGFSIEYGGERTIQVHKPFNKDFDAYYHFSYLSGFSKELDKYKPDVLITEAFFQWTPRVIFYAKRRGIPVYISYERTVHTERNAPWYLRWHRKLTDKFVKGYFANGTETKQYLLSLGIKPEKIHIGGMNADSEGLRNSIAAMSESDKKALRKELHLDDNGITYLYSGQMIPRKGVGYLLNVWQQHIDMHSHDHLLLVGNGELLDKFQKQYGNIPSIQLLGHVPYVDVHRYYAISDVFVIPTLEDNWCLVVPEAMACGMPVACSKYNGGAVDLIRQGENGFVFDPLSETSVLQALDGFHGKNLAVMGQRSIELENPWNTEHAAQRVYKAIVEDWNKK